MYREMTSALAFLQAAFLYAVLMAITLASEEAQTVEKTGSSPYATHFIFRAIMSIDVPGLGTATNLEAIGTTQEMKGEKMLEFPGAAVRHGARPRRGKRAALGGIEKRHPRERRFAITHAR
jgi:hypothetical protein